MSDALMRSINALPPADLEAERLFLGALLVAEQYDRNQFTLLVKPEAFHDPFYYWMFRALRQARQCSTVSELVQFLGREVERPSWIGQNFAIWVAQLINRHDGTSHAGQVRLLRTYAERLNRTHRRRERIEKLESELLSLIFDPRMECGDDRTDV